MKIENLYGVWANKSSQLVVTGKHLMFFEKHNGEVRVYGCSYKIKLGTILLDLKAIVNFNESKKSYNSLFKSDKNDAILQWGDKEYKIINPQIFEIDMNDDITENLGLKLNNPNYLEFVSFEGVHHNLKLVRKIEITDFKEQPKANKNNIGYCLSNWNKLARIEKSTQEKDIFSFEIVLGNMDFNFNIIEKELIYCSVNITAANNNGRVWDQKIRLMNHPESKQFAILYPDNCYDSLKEKITIDDDLFMKDTCNFLPGMLRYWSLYSFNDDQIIINGCGEKYTINRIIGDSSSLVDIEFFKD